MAHQTSMTGKCSTRCKLPTNSEHGKSRILAKGESLAETETHKYIY